jgi:hypothetical protein
MIIPATVPSPFARLWHRGGQWELEEQETQWGWSKHRINLVDWPSLKTYDPITEAPTAYLAFARLRSDLWLFEEPGWGDNVVLEADGLPSHDTLNQWQQLLAFMEQYGPPLDWHRGFTVEEALEDSRLMAIAARCYQASEPDGSRHRPTLQKYFIQLQEGGAQLRSYSPQGYRGYRGTDLLQVADFTREAGLIKSARAWLEDIINYSPHALMGFHVQQTYNENQGWQPQYWYETLANLMWFQLHQAILKSAPLRQCLGCEELFEAERSNQVYHDVYCRGAANARKSYRRKHGDPT